MNASFSFEIDRPRDLVRIQMSGLFTATDVAAFVEIQTQEIVAEFRLMLSDPAYRSRRLAFVAAPTLARGQLLRALQDRDARCFETIEAAEAWLLAEEADEMPQPRYAIR
jgi:hypothetical protein